MTNSASAIEPARPYSVDMSDHSSDGVRCTYKGDPVIAKALIEQLSAEDVLAGIEKTLKAQKHYTGGIIETERFTFGWADHIRSFPISYAQNEDEFLISPQALDVVNQAKLTKQDEASVIEFAMSGYATGPYTLYEGLYALQPGECVLWDKAKKKRSNLRYYRYLPQPAKPDWDANERQLADIMDELTKGMIERADGRRIWVPLSAGLDSRIILCKLHEQGYRNIEAFTYGPRYNFELLHAKKIARALGVPWRHITLSGKQLRRYFKEDRRKNYWAYAGQYKTIASMREYSALAYMHDSGVAQPGDVFINGQSGDYITGGHIFPGYFTKGKTDLKGFFENIFDKHYSLWRCLLTYEFKAIISKRVATIIGDEHLQGESNAERAVQEEIWEYDARQICLVANGQRSYEFFGYDWEMPLWDKALCDFYEHISLEEKQGQALYKRYLQNYNYKGLFPAKEPKIWRWPVYMLWVLPVAQFIKLAQGNDAKNDFYALMKYHGHYSNQYGFISWEEHKSTHKTARNVMSLYVRRFLVENGFNLPPLTSEESTHVG